MEVTIKRLECMLLDEVVRLRSSNLLDFFSDSKVLYDAEKGTFSKDGGSLKIGDRVFFDESGVSSEVEELYYESSVAEARLVEGMTYEAFLPQDSRLRRFTLESIDDDAKWYRFVEEGESGMATALVGNFEDLPPLYRTGEGQNGPNSVLLKTAGGLKEVSIDQIAGKELELDFSGCHVVVALG